MDTRRSLKPGSRDRSITRELNGRWKFIIVPLSLNTIRYRGAAALFLQFVRRYTPRISFQLKVAQQLSPASGNRRLAERRPPIAITVTLFPIGARRLFPLTTRQFAAGDATLKTVSLPFYAGDQLISGRHGISRARDPRGAATSAAAASAAGASRDCGCCI